MFAPEDILYEDNHLLIVNKRCGDLVQPDPSGGDALERQIKEFIRRRDAKPGEVLSKSSFYYMWIFNTCNAYIPFKTFSLSRF